MITGWIGDRQKDASLYDPDIFVLGDFNIPGLKSKTYKALVKHGLTIPTQLRTIRTNLKQNAHYDQIGYYEENTDCTIKRAGSIDIVPSFFKGLGKTAHNAMTYQLSDHLPLWVELEVHEANLDQFIRQ